MTTRLSPAGEGIVVVFRNEAQVADASVRLPVAETRKFQVRSAMTGREMGVVTGAELRRGFRVVLPRTGAVEILELRTAVPTLPTLLPEPPGGDR